MLEFVFYQSLKSSKKTIKKIILVELRKFLVQTLQSWAESALLVGIELVSEDVAVNKVVPVAPVDTFLLS